MQTQRSAYFNAITSVLEENGVEFVESQTVVKDVITSEMKEEVMSIVIAGFNNGTIALKDTPANQEKLANPSKLREYAKSTLHNWLIKDTRLNGGVKHEIKNKGSRAGQGDKLVKNYKALQVQFPVGSEQYNLIQTKIDARKAEIAAEKAKASQKEVDFSLIPDDLKKELGL